MVGVPLRVEWQGPTGPRWVLEGLVDDIGGAVLTSVSGMVSKVERAAHPTSHGVGVTLGPVVTGEMEGSLSIAVRGSADRPVGEVYALFERSFSTHLPGRLTVVDGRSRRWMVDAFLRSPLPVTEQSPWAPGSNIVQCVVDLRAPEGVWLGDPQIFTPKDGAAVVENLTGLPAFPTIVWEGVGCIIETPLGASVRLPTVSGQRLLSTDPGRGFTITDRGGNVDTSAWSAMRGQPVWGEIPPYGAATWRVLSGDVHFEVTPMIENPWR